MARSAELAALTSPFIGALVVSLVEGWWPEAEAGAAELSSRRVVEGDIVEFSIQVKSHRPTMVELELQFPAGLVPLTPTRFVTVVKASKKFVVTVRADRWGAAGPEWAVLTTRDRLGVSERIVRYPLHLPVRVPPPAEKLKSLIPLYKERQVTGEHRAKSKGSSKGTQTDHPMWCYWSTLLKTLVSA